MRKLVLCEKPSVARDLAQALGISARGSFFSGQVRSDPGTKNARNSTDELVIAWCIGHLIELEEPAAYNEKWRRWSWDGLPMIPDHFLLRPIKQTQKQWKVVRELLRQRDFSVVVNACDAGREGELIFRLCYELAGCKLPIERLWISSLTPQSIRRGFAELRSGQAYDALAAAARCRSQADWLVGLNATRAVTIWRGGKTLLSLGRVQTPTLAMLVNREGEIQRFKPRDYFEVEAQLRTESNAASFVARFEYDGKRRLAARAPADSIAERDAAATPPWVESVDEKPVREPPPLLFDLGALQRTCNRRYGWSATQTLGLAQALYERHKLITYPRTDSRYLSHDLVSQLERLFAALAENPSYAPFCAPLQKGDRQAPRRIFQDHKVTDHHAIIPTTVEHTAARLAALSDSERKLLDLVVRRFLGAFYPDAEFLETRAVVRVDAAPTAKLPAGLVDQEGYLTAAPPAPDRYLARGRVRVRAGWQDVAGFVETSLEKGAGDEAEDDDADKAQSLPPLTVGARLRGQFQVVAKQTRPPPRYTEATLLAAMEGAGKKLSDAALRQAMKDHGLGTPATRAAIIETLLHRGYLERRSKLLVPTDLGCELVTSLPVPSLCSAELTGAWEARLSHLARGEGSADSFMADIAESVRQMIAAVHAASPPPPLAEAPRTTKSRPFKSEPRTKGKATGKKRATSASPRTRAATGTKSGSSKTKKRAKATATTAASGTATRRPRATKDVVARRVQPPETPPPGTPVSPPILCPRCRKANLLWGRRAWGCANFRVCPLVIAFEPDGRRLTIDELRELCAQDLQISARRASE